MQSSPSDNYQRTTREGSVSACSDGTECGTPPGRCFEYIPSAKRKHIANDAANTRGNRHRDLSREHYCHVHSPSARSHTGIRVWVRSDEEKIFWIRFSKIRKWLKYKFSKFNITNFSSWLGFVPGLLYLIVCMHFRVAAKTRANFDQWAPKLCLYSVSQENPPAVFWHFFQTVWNF